MEIKKLENRWVNLFGSANDTNVVKKVFDDLITRYSEKHRFYHTLEHINACLEQLDDAESLISELFNIEVAIWFHDVIYDPTKHDNEEKSAEYAKYFLESIEIESSEIEKIKYLILLTKHPSSPNKKDEEYLIDIDLSILGAHREHFDNYESWIRKEYAVVPDLQYKKGRKKVLNSFLKMNNIFQTDFFNRKYEAQARDNINHALLKL